MAIPNNRVNRFIEDQDTRVSVGIKLPFVRQPGSSKGDFATTDTTLDAVKQDVRLLLMTQRGERLFQPTLGMNIRRFLFEQVTENTVVEMENDIVATFERWLPFVNLSEINIDLESKNQIRINVQFNIENAPTELESVGVVLE